MNAYCVRNWLCLSCRGSASKGQAGKCFCKDARVLVSPLHVPHKMLENKEEIKSVFHIFQASDGIKVQE